MPDLLLRLALELCAAALWACDAAADAITRIEKRLLDRAAIPPAPILPAVPEPLDTGTHAIIRRLLQ